MTFGLILTIIICGNIVRARFSHDTRSTETDPADTFYIGDAVLIIGGNIHDDDYFVGKTGEIVGGNIVDDTVLVQGDGMSFYHEFPVASIRQLLGGE